VLEPINRSPTSLSRRLPLPTLSRCGSCSLRTSPDNRFLIQAYLKKLPYRIEIAENGQVAIEKFKATRPDLVLMDVQMPEIDGLAATRAIRQWESEQGAFSDADNRANCVGARGRLGAQPGRRLRSARQQAGQKTDPTGSDSQGGGDAHGRCRRAGASGRRELGRM
jgi:CheY-like chemotaxis protein